MLTFTFLGTGGAFAKRNYQSNVLVEAWEGPPAEESKPVDALLIDFGSTGPLALHELQQQQGFEYLSRQGRTRYSAIRSVFITHLHGDHVGGLEELALISMFLQTSASKPPARPRLISTGPILDALWEHSLKGGMGTLQGRRMSMTDYFDLAPLDLSRPDADHFDLAERYRCRPFATDHIRQAELFDWPSLGLIIEDQESGETVFFSGDGRLRWDLYSSAMETARFCFHEVEFVQYPNPVHAMLHELQALDPEVKRKTYLYHYDDDWDSGAYAFVNQEFAGFAEPGRRYEVLP